jgi:hypothetical protein
MQIDLGQGWEGRLSARGANSGRQGPTEAEGLNQLGRRKDTSFLVRRRQD